MVIPNARLLVAPPSRTPLPYGLLSAAQMPASTDIHWQNGVQIEPDTCERASIFTSVCASEPVDKLPTATTELRCSDPFTVYTMPVCATVGYYAEAERRAVGALTSGEARAVEREFESGEFGTNPHLAANTAIVTGADGCIEQTAATVPFTGAPSVDHAIAHLESALAECYGNEGVIHVPPVVAARAARYFLFTKDGPRLRSPAGHLVVIGSGYRGLSPAGAVPPHDSPWLYATGAVFVYRSEINVTSGREAAVDKAKNSVYLVAERTYVVGWDCCHFAMQTDFDALL